MRSALFAATLITAASAAKVQEDKRQVSLPVEDISFTLPNGDVVTTDPLGTFTDTVTSTGIIVPTIVTPSPSLSVSVSVSPSVSVSVSTDTDTVTSPSSSSTSVSATTVTTTATTQTETTTETETATETTETDGQATETDDGEDAAPLATPFAGAAMAAVVGIALAL